MPRLVCAPPSVCMILPPPLPPNPPHPPPTPPLPSRPPPYLPPPTSKVGGGDFVRYMTEYNGQSNAHAHEGHTPTRDARKVFPVFSEQEFFTSTDFIPRCTSGVAVSDTARADDRLQVSFKYTSRHHGWYAAQVPHGTTYVVLTLSFLIRPVWPSTYEELVSLSQKKKDQ